MAWLVLVTMDADLLSIARYLARSSNGWEMAVRGGQSLELTDALWDLVEPVVTAGAQANARSPQEVADATRAGRRLSEQARAQLRTTADSWAATASSAFSVVPIDHSALESLTAASSMADPFGSLSSVVDIAGLAETLLPGLSEAGGASADETAYVQAYLRASARRERTRTPILLRALFVTAVSTVEPLVTRLIHLLLQFTQPTEYSSLTDPRLDTKARDLSYGGPAKWREKLRDQFGISRIDTVVDWAAFERLWEDRHAIVHRAGVVDARHSTRTGVDVGSLVKFDSDKVRAVIDVVGAVRFGLVAIVWERMDPLAAAMMVQESGILADESLSSGRWRQAAGLSRVQRHFATTPEDISRAQVNIWLATARGLGIEAIREDVVSWDTAVLPPEFQLAKLILLQDDEQALVSLRDLIAAGRITRDNLANWPLFDDLRERGLLS